jgi:hypothetical protein
MMPEDNEAMTRIVTMLHDSVKDMFSGALDEDNSMVLIRNVAGNLIWMKANVHGGGVEWQELLPTVARETQLIEVLESIEGPKPKNTEEKIGWYQDSKGDLYQFDGKTWLGSMPTRVTVNELEYLGK